MLRGSRDPDAVVLHVALPVAQDEYDLLLDVDRGASEHRARPRAEVGQLFEHEPEGDRLSWLARRKQIIGGPAHDLNRRRAGRPVPARQLLMIQVTAALIGRLSSPSDIFTVRFVVLDCTDTFEDAAAIEMFVPPACTIPVAKQLLNS